MAKEKRSNKAKKKVTEPKGFVYIKCTFNNTLVTISTRSGNVVAWSTGGNVGYKGSRKSTPYAAQLAAEKAATEAFNAGMKEVEIFIKGAGAGRETAIRSVASAGLKVSAIRDVTPLPHNGCRPRKKRRI